MQTGATDKLTIVPITLREANEFVVNFHRHNGRTARNGGKFAIGATLGTQLVGVAIVGNPISASFMGSFTAEVLRACVLLHAPGDYNINSFLYGACWRVWRAMGGRKLITYTLQDESGASLRGAGWKIVAEVQPTKEGWNKNDHLTRQWQPVQGQLKFRWEIAV